MLGISIVINLIIAICEIVTLANIKGKTNIFKYYTYFQNLIALIVSIIYIIGTSICMVSNNIIPEFIKGLRYISTCGLISTMFIFVVFLGAGKRVSITQEDFHLNFNYKIANIILHYICPILSLLSFIIFEREINLNDGLWTIIVIIPSCIYWIIYIILTSTKVWNEPYNFSSNKNKIWEVLVMIFIPLSFIVISFVLWNIK